MVLDSDYGVGAYKISGGASGSAVVTLFTGSLLSVLGLYLVSSGALPLLAGLSIGIGVTLFLSSTIALLLSGDLNLTEVSVFRAIAASIALIVLGSEAAATVALAGMVGLIVSMISTLFK